MNNNNRLKHTVPVNIEERDDCYRLTLYAAGFPEEDITLSVVADTLVIKGRADENKDELVAFIKQEYPVYGFERRLFLDNRVETDCISTRFSNGVLTVFLPKKSELSLQELQRQMDLAIPG
ncbi:MAG: Hsp20/alpha crystallin family protein [Niabella sp.]|nr:Hsp20/alpha crystallin family protein [Niabella sp.]